MEINSVESLLSRQTISREEKIAIKEKGRPTPDLVFTRRENIKSQTYERLLKINKTIYDKYEWLCGCPVRNRLYCFTCLIYQKKDVPAWTRHGVDDMKHIAEIAKKHERCAAHLKAQLDFKLLGKPNIRDQLKNARLQRKSKCNGEVEKNRRVLYRLIKCIKFCGAFELDLQDRDERPNVCTGLINFAAQMDSVLATDLKYTKLFEGSTETIQNGLLDGILQVYRTEVLKQIQDANFISILIEANQTLETPLTIILIRYVFNGEICERFWSLINTTSDHLLADALLEELQVILNYNNHKLIAQCYDDANVGVQQVINKTFVNSHFVHCYAYQFNVVAERAVQCYKELRIFFANIQAFSNFFSYQDRAKAVLAGRRLNFKSKTVNTVFECQESLTEYLEKFIDKIGMGFEEINEACCLLQCLTDSSDFLYWLDVIRRIMPHGEKLFDQVRARGIENWQVQNAVDHFEEQIRNTMEAVTGQGDEKHVIAIEACNAILTEIKERFKFKDHLHASNLFFTDYFIVYRENFPKTKFDAVVKTYSMLDSDKLRAELMAIYQLDDICEVSDVSSFLTFMRHNNLQNMFSETYKLADIVCTTPMATSERERCFSTVERVNTFLARTVVEDRLDAWAVLSIEKQFIQSVADFDKKVIDVFDAQKDETMQLADDECQAWKSQLGFTGDHKYANIGSDSCFKKIRICSVHFSDESFMSPLKQRLQYNAIPTLFLSKPTTSAASTTSDTETSYAKLKDGWSQTNPPVGTNSMVQTDVCLTQNQYCQTLQSIYSKSLRIDALNRTINKLEKEAKKCKEKLESGITLEDVIRFMDDNNYPAEFCTFLKDRLTLLNKSPRCSRCQKWKNILGFVGTHRYANITPLQSYNRIKVCELHFEANSFANRSRNRIYSYAVPSPLLLPTNLAEKGDDSKNIQAQAEQILQEDVARHTTINILFCNPTRDAIPLLSKGVTVEELLGQSSPPREHRTLQVATCLFNKNARWNKPTSSNTKRSKLDEQLDEPDFVILDPADSQIKIEEHELEGLEEEDEDTIFYEEQLPQSINENVKEEVVADDATVAKPDPVTRSETSQSEARHPIQTFFDSIATTVIQFPPPLAVRAKVEVLQVISNLELEAWNVQPQPGPST